MDITKTAYWAAAARAEESSRADRLFEDPYAQHFAGEMGVQMLAHLDAKEQGRNPLVSIRTRLFDDYVNEVLSSLRITQVVNLACGFDARVFRLNVAPGVTFYELDQDEIIQRKIDTLKRLAIPINCDWRPIAANLHGDWENHLLEAGFDPRQPSVWLAEGLFYYFEEGASRDILNKVSRLSSADSSLICDLINDQMMNSQLPSIVDLNRKMRELNSPWIFGVNDPGRFLLEWGWVIEKLLHPGEEEANFGRWPARIPVIPRDAPGWPRFYLISARKR